MTLSSMTGFARLSESWENYHWTWEIKSVNGRNLDVRCRTPQGLDAVEQMARKTLKDNIARGSVNINLQMNRDTDGTSFKVNQEMLDALVEIATTTAMNNHLPQPSLDALMGVRDVIQYVEAEEDEATLKARDAALKTSFAAALSAFKLSRDTEGAAMQEVLTGLLDEIERLVKQADSLTQQMPDLIRKRYLDKVNALLDDKTGIDPDRIAQEVVLLATKADIKEEIDRLYAHIEAARSHIDADGQIGRKLDFLTQEFNREANTLCSKASDIRLTDIGLSLKTTIDQFREQVQNIE
ncbi:MAG: YicC family protein [Alphaproteobacteria bacterium]|nr:MAG: YicC family protein [Alphaproteobacteria bacterium]